jgi:hypothetical protein
MGHAVVENRNCPAVSGDMKHATGTAEREAALIWVDEQGPARRITLGGDKAYDVIGFVEALKERNVTPHIAIKRQHSMARRTP